MRKKSILMNCEGCGTYKHPLTGVVDCSFEGYNENGDCPCTLCVVKPMCNYACEEFEEFREITNLVDL